MGEELLESTKGAIVDRFLDSWYERGALFHGFHGKARDQNLKQSAVSSANKRELLQLISHEPWWNNSLSRQN